MEKYRRKILINKCLVVFTQVFVLLSFFILWEVLVDKGFLNEFIVSKPSSIYELFKVYLKDGNLIGHIEVSLY